MGLVGAEGVGERIVRGVDRAALGVHRDRAGRGIPGERRRLGRALVVVGQDVALTPGELHLGPDRGVGVAGERSGLVLRDEDLLEVAQLADHRLQIVHVRGALGTPVGADVEQCVVTEAPPEQALGAFHDGHVGVIAHFLERRPAGVVRRLEELQDGEDWPRVEDGVSRRARPVGDPVVRIATSLRAPERVGIGAEHVGRVAPERQRRIAQERRERHAVGIQAPQPHVLVEHAVDQRRPALPAWLPMSWT